MKESRSSFYGRLRFFVIGAPKCGTTLISSWLASHPDVFHSSVKEPHHFYSPVGAELPYENYVSLFDGATEAQVLGESSVWYLYSEKAIRTLVERVGSPRFIVCLRDPVEMMLSLHAQKRFSGYEMFKNVEDAWRAGKAREAGQAIGVRHLRGGDLSHMSYRSACSVGEQVDRLLRIVPSESVLFLPLTDIKSQPQETWDRICDHVGVVRTSLPSSGDQNSAKVHRNEYLHQVAMWLRELKNELGWRSPTGVGRILKRVNSRRQGYRVPSAEFLREVRTELSEDIALLESITGLKIYPSTSMER